MLGSLAFLIGLWKASLPLSEKDDYVTLLMYGLFCAMAAQSSIRDRIEDIPVTNKQVCNED